MFIPVQFNPGPNNRFWSLAPNTTWNLYRQTNIKAALAIIHAWWLDNPDLLVGFSTYSEIHEEDNTFQSTNLEIILHILIIIRHPLPNFNYGHKPIGP